MRSLTRSVVVATALALIVAGAAGASEHSLSRAAAVPDFGPNVKILDPSMTTAQIKAIVDPIAAQQIVERVRHAALRVALQAGHLRRVDSAQLQRRLLHGGRRARRASEPGDDQRHGRRPQPVRLDRLLHGAHELLALALEPDDPRRLGSQGRLRRRRRVLGGIAGRTDATRPDRQRADDALRLLLRPVLLERRLHRRLGPPGTP